MTNDPREILWMFHRGWPGVFNSKKSSYVRRFEWQGSSFIRKVFRNKRDREIRIRRELLARKVFADKDWVVPILDSGDDWIVMPFLPQSCRMDRAIKDMGDDTKAEVADQLLSVLLDIHTAGYVHRDFHSKNLFWQNSRILVCDFEGFASYRDGERPPFAECYDMTRNRRGIEFGLVAGQLDKVVFYYFLGGKLSSGLGLDRDTVLAHLRDSLTSELAGSAYGSFSLPELSFPASLARRDSAQRLSELGVVEAEAKGASMLDLGCDVGSLLFEAQKFGPGHCVGIESDGAKVALARRVAAFTGVNAVTFIDSGDRAAVAEGLAEPFDLVFCRLWSSPFEADELYGMLGRVTGRRLFIEGDEGTSVAELEGRLHGQGFGTVRPIGHGDGRPLFVAEKE